MNDVYPHTQHADISAKYRTESPDKIAPFADYHFAWGDLSAWCFKDDIPRKPKSTNQRPQEICIHLVDFCV